MRTLALNALNLYNLNYQQLRLLTNHLNAIFRVDTPDDRYILRVSLPEGGHTRDHTEAEMEWLEALARDTTLSVPRPLLARDGRLVTSAMAPGVPEERTCAVFSWVPGVDLASRLTHENIRLQGRLMAQLHEQASNFQFASERDILRFDRVFYFPEPVVIFDESTSGMMTPGQRKKFQHWHDSAGAAIAQLVQSGEDTRVMHGDLHQWNIRASKGVLSPIDFEDLILGWPVQDIAISLYYYQDEDDYPRMRAAFEEGYRDISPWPERWDGEIDAFIAARGLSLLNFVLQNWKMLDMDPQKFSDRSEWRLDRLRKT